MATNDLLQVLQQTLSGDRAQLQHAQQWLEQACQADAGSFLLELSKVLQNSANDPTVRTAAGLQLKNFLSARDITVRKEKFAAWARIDPQSRAQIKKNVLETLGTEHASSHAAPAIIAALAIGEIPAEEWPELIPFLCDAIIGEQSTQERRQACLESIGYICEDVDGAFLLRDANRILTGIIFGVQEQHPPRMRLAGIRALMHALDFCKGNFDNERERTYIMEVVCRATQPPPGASTNDDESVQVQVAALQCMSRIVTLYYQGMEMYMKALCAISHNAMQSDVQEVALQGVEFWSTVAEEERDLSSAERENALDGRTSTEKNYHFVNAELSTLCQLLLPALTRQSEAEDDDEWTVAKAATVCLMFLAQAAGDDIVGHIIPFAGANVEVGSAKVYNVKFESFFQLFFDLPFCYLNYPQNSDWRFRDAAATAVGAILEGPDSVQLCATVVQALPYILKLMRDTNALVRDSASWTMARICDHVKEAVLTPENFVQVLQVLHDNLQLSSTRKVAAHSCYTLASLVEASYNYAIESMQPTNREEDPAANGGDDADLATVPATSPISMYFEQFVQQLLLTAKRPDANQSNLRVAAYEALTEIIEHSARDCSPTIFNTCVEFIQQITEVISQQELQQQLAVSAGASVTATSEMAQRGDLLQLILPVINAGLRRLPVAECEKFREKLVELMFRVCDLASAAAGAAHLNCEPEAFTILSTLVMKLQANFLPHLPKLGEYLAWAIGGGTNNTEHAMTGAACALLSDICKSVLGPTIHGAVPSLIQSLTNVIERAGNDSSGVYARINAISCVGDIALLLNIDFGGYVAHTFALLEKCLREASEGPYLGGKGASSSAAANGESNGAASMHDWYGEYADLRDSIIECFDTVTEALRSGNMNDPVNGTQNVHPQTSTILRPHVDGIMSAIQKCYLDGDLISEVAVRHAAGLIANLTLIFGSELLPYLQTDFVIGLLNHGKKTKSFSMATKAVCSLAIKQIKRLKTRSVLGSGVQQQQVGEVGLQNVQQQQLNVTPVRNDTPSQMGNKQPLQQSVLALNQNDVIAQQQQPQQQHSVFGGALAVNNPGTSISSGGGFQ